MKKRELYRDISVQKKPRLRLHPATKILMCLMVNVPIYGIADKSIILPFVALALILLVLSREYKAAVKYVLVYAVITSIGVFSEYIPDIIINLTAAVIVSLQTFLPFIAYGLLLIRTTAISEAAQMMDQIRMPNGVIIPFLVMLRFFPTIREEKSMISDAMKLRGIGIDPKNILRHPLKTAEFIYVPMLFTLLNIGSELTMASLTRGLGGTQRRSYLSTVHMTWQDAIVLAIFFAMIVFSFYLKMSGGIA